MHAKKRQLADLPSNGDVAQRAYQRWVARGRPVSDGLEDWFAAEAELRAEPGTPPAKGRTIRSALRRLGI